MPYIMLILSAFFWSGNFVLSRGMHAEISPVRLSFWRWAIALLILLPFALKQLKQDRQIIQKNLKFILFQGIVSIAIAPGCETLVDGIITSLAAGEDIMIESFAPEDCTTCFQGHACVNST